MSVVVFDLDSTVCDTRHRHHLSPHNNDGATWETYAQGCGDDTPIAGTVRLAQLLSGAGFDIYLLTGRHISANEATVKWLGRHGMPWTVLRMVLEEENMTPHIAYKTGVVRDWLADLRDVVLAVEDWPPMVEAYEAMGIPTICVNPRYRDDPMEFFASVVPDRVDNPNELLSG